MPKPNMGKSHQSLLTQMTGVPRAFQTLQRTKKKGEQCVKTHCLSHLKTQLGQNILIPSFILTYFVCRANNRETNRSAPPFFFLLVDCHCKSSLSFLTSSYIIGATFSYRQEPDGVVQAGNLTLQNPPIIQKKVHKNYGFYTTNITKR